MKLNNKGFAITIVLYGTFILFLLLIISMLGILSTYKLRLSKLIDETNGARDIAELVPVVSDETGPVITFDPNGNDTYAKSQSTKITIEDESGVASVKYVWSTTSTASGASGTSTSSGATLTKSSGTGKYYLCVYATDNVGNATNTCSNAFYLDNTAPTCSSKVYAYTDYGKIKVTASDSGSGIADKGYMYKYGDTEKWESNSTKEFYGAYNVHVYVRDKAGNETYCSEVTWKKKYKYYASSVHCCYEDANCEALMIGDSDYIYSSSTEALKACKANCNLFDAYDSGCDETGSTYTIYKCVNRADDSWCGA